jgi:hypothetical protein
MTCRSQSVRCGHATPPGHSLGGAGGAEAGAPAEFAGFFNNSARL